MILTHGRHSDTLHLILKGRVKVERTLGLAVPRLVADLGPGDWVGEMGTFSGVARAATATTLEDVDTLELPESELHRTLRHDHPFLVALVRLMNQRFRQLN